MKYGIQLFSLRKYLKDEKGYEQVFKRTKETGAQVVQLSGGKPVAPEYIRSLSDKYDLPVCITHDNFDRLENDLDALIAEHRIYGCNRMGVGMMPKKFRTGKLEDLDKCRESLAHIIAKRTHKNIEEIYKVTVNDAYFTATEAIDFGLATDIITGGN